MSSSIIVYIIAGFIAQIIDGSLGMAYGVSCTTLLLSFGIPASIASASVHTSELCTTLASGISHRKMGNFNKELFKPLVTAGVVGGIIGAYILTSIPGDIIKPYVYTYLLFMGIVIFLKAFKNKIEFKNISQGNLKILGLIGGFFDAIGGGGWGPIVTSTLIGRGYEPKNSIGTVNTAEFFVTVAQVITFAALIKVMSPKIILGLIIGGVAGAPIGAYLCNKIKTKHLFLVVGILIITISIKTIISCM